MVDFEFEGEEEVYDLDDLADVLYDRYEGTDALADYTECVINDAYPETCVTIGHEHFSAGAIIREMGDFDTWQQQVLEEIIEDAREALSRGVVFRLPDGEYLNIVEDDEDEEDDE